MRDDELDGREASNPSSEAEAGRRRSISIHLRVRPSTEDLQAVSVDDDLRTVRISVLRNAEQGYDTELSYAKWAWQGCCCD